jgi:hypothetical protein
MFWNGSTAIDGLSGSVTPQWWIVWKRLTLIGRLEKRT